MKWETMEQEWTGGISPKRYVLFPQHWILHSSFLWVCRCSSLHSQRLGQVVSLAYKPILWGQVTAKWTWTRTLWFCTRRVKSQWKHRQLHIISFFLILGTSKNWIERISFLPFLDAKSLTLVFAVDFIAYSNITAFCIFFSAKSPWLLN